MSEEQAVKLAIAREKIREVGWANYVRKRNIEGSMCTMEAIEFAVGKNPEAYINLAGVFKDANGIANIIDWNDDPTFKLDKRGVIRAFNVAIDYARR